MDIDKMLAKSGDFGRYQFMLMGLFCVINMLSSMHYYSQTIISFVPNHWCFSDVIANKTFDEIASIYSTYKNPSCTMLKDNPISYDVARSAAASSIIAHPNQDDIIIAFQNVIDRHQVIPIFYRTSNYDILARASSADDDDDDDDQETTIGDYQPNCNKWIYELDFGYQSITSELNWVCDSAWKSTLGQSMFFIGSVIGSLTFGILADVIGRLPVLILANLMAFIGNGATIFSTDVIVFSICRFISGLATDSNFVMMYILVMEYIRPSMRTFGLNLCIGVFYCIGSMITPWIAVALGNWKLYLLATSMPIIIVPTFYFVLPESARWLIAKKDFDGAINCFKRVAKCNGKYLSESDIQEFKYEYGQTLGSTSSTKSNSLFGLFKTKRLRRNTLILFFKSMVITLCYDAISRNVEGLGVSPFIMFSLSATAIFPACVVILLLQDRIGRKAMASSSLLISGIFTAATGIIIAYQQGAQEPALLASMAIIGRFGVTVAYNSGAQYATELIPTCVRAQGVAAVHVAGYALTFFSSYILYLSNIFKPLPPLILGGLSFAGAILCLFLPETLNRTMPCTLEEGELFGKGEKIFDFSCFEKVKNVESQISSTSTSSGSS